VSVGDGAYELVEADSWSSVTSSGGALTSAACGGSDRDRRLSMEVERGTGKARRLCSTRGDGASDTPTALSAAEAFSSMLSTTLG
jgi:hypothetical protein